MVLVEGSVLGLHGFQKTQTRNTIADNEETADHLYRQT